MLKYLFYILSSGWLCGGCRHGAQYDRKDRTMQMKTQIGYPTYYTVIYRKRLGVGLSDDYFRRHLGNYSDIRDAIQEIVNLSRKEYKDVGEFLIGTTTTKPKSLLHPTRYEQN